MSTAACTGDDSSGALGYDLLLVCGLPRSGTTYVGNVLMRSGRVRLVYEPLNPGFGIAGAPPPYVHLDPATGVDEPTTTALLDDVATFRAAWNRVAPAGSTVQTRWKRRLYGGRTGLRWQQLTLLARLGRIGPTVLWKDPFLTFAAGYVAAHYDARVVCVIKHPCAQYYSYRKRGWRFEISSLRQNAALVRSYASDVSARLWDLALENDAAGAALCWKIMRRVVSTQAARDRRILVVRHEDLCAEPLRVVGEIADHCRVPVTVAMRRYVGATTSGARAEGAPGALHDFTRDTRALADVWRGRISPADEALIRRIVGPDGDAAVVRPPAA